MDWCQHQAIKEQITMTIKKLKQAIENVDDNVEVKIMANGYEAEIETIIFNLGTQKQTIVLSDGRGTY